MFRSSIVAILIAAFCNLAEADEKLIRNETRGELLYSTFCISCHSDKVHWRDKRLVVDWTTLRFEIDRWQTFSNLGWANDDIDEVARHLNSLYYHFPSQN
jgi:hypothetical protein